MLLSHSIFIPNLGTAQFWLNIRSTIL